MPIRSNAYSAAIWRRVSSPSGKTFNPLYQHLGSGTGTPIWSKHLVIKSISVCIPQILSLQCTSPTSCDSPANFLGNAVSCCFNYDARVDLCCEQKRISKSMMPYPEGKVKRKIWRYFQVSWVKEKKGLVMGVGTGCCLHSVPIRMVRFLTSIWHNNVVHIFRKVLLEQTQLLISTLLTVLEMNLKIEPPQSKHQIVVNRQNRSEELSGSICSALTSRKNTDEFPFQMYEGIRYWRSQFQRTSDEGQYVQHNLLTRYSARYQTG